MSVDGFSCYVIGGDSLLIACAELLRRRGHDVLGVVTSAPHLARWAADQGLPVTDAAGDYAAALREREFDYLFSIAHLAMVPDAVLELPRRAAVNFHDGPLPRYAGLNTPSWALLEGEAEHGISWHRMSREADAGDVLEKERFAVDARETSLTLNAKCFEAGLASFERLVDALAAGTPLGEAQDLEHRRVFLRDDRPPDACLIDWQKSAVEIERLVRALDFGAYANALGAAKALLDGRTVVVGGARALADEAAAAPGSIARGEGGALHVATGDGVVAIESLREPDGATVPLDAVGAERFMSVDAATRARLSERGSELARAEPFWVERLSAYAPVVLPLARGAAAGAATDGAGAVVDVPEAFRVGCGADDPAGAVMCAFAAFASRAAGLSAVDLALHRGPHENGLGTWLADRVPCRFDVDAESGFLAALEAGRAELARVRSRPGWLLDLVGRHPRLRENAALVGARLGGVAIDPTGVAGPLPGADFTLGVTPDGATARLHGSTEEAAPLEGLAREFEAFLRRVGADPERPLGEVSLVPEDQEERLLVEWNRTQKEYRADTCLHRLFEEQAQRTPDADALVCGGDRVSYRTLDERANQVAHHLAGLGVATGDLVGIHVERGIDMMVAAIGTLKAGAAYVPLDPTYPGDRIAYMVRDARLQAVITQAHGAADLPEEAESLVRIDADWPQIAEHATEPPAAAVVGSDLAYVIYTSGSTGRPKGVMVEHRNVVNFFAGMDDRIPHEGPGVWLAVTSLSFDISVLELFWTLARGFRVILHTGVHESGGAHARPIDFSLFYFASDEGGDEDKYRLLIEGARFADANGFSAVWTPERHFHAFGGLYPNPAVASAAIAAITERIGIRSGSVVLPLHHPARIAEEWALVDNLSRGRVGLSFASGWHARDFVLRPGAYDDRHKRLYEGIDTVRRLWRGESVAFEDPTGTEIEVRTLPRPVQAELPFWVTAAGNPETFRSAGKIGAHLLTHMLGQTLEEVAEKVRIYREAWRANGHGPEGGHVTIMLHTFVGDDVDAVREIVRKPMTDYLRSSLGLIRGVAGAWAAFKRRADGTATGADVDVGGLPPEELEDLLAFSFERYFETSALFGTPESCAAMVESLKGAGIDEIACLIDFGVESGRVLDSFGRLDRLRRDTERTTMEAAAARRRSVGALIEEHGVTHMQCVPSMARMLTLDPGDRDALGRLRVLMVGGEAFSADLAAELRGLTGAALLNMYGPTETTIWSSTESVDEADGAVPIGRPIANTSLYIVDDHMNPVPIGAEGELLIGGAGVVRGYLRRDELTAERFVPDPFAAGSSGAAEGARLYRTGDLVRYRADGTVEFLGRTDHQVKVRGYRVELGEIEAALRARGSVRDAVVVAREVAADDVRLVAYVTAADGASLAVGPLRELLQATLPEYMVPSHVIALDALPLTPNGKVDRKRLPAPEDARRAGSDGFEPPQGPVEEIIAGIWREVLHIDAVGANDGFFELGGHSLLAIKARQRIEDAFGCELPITDLFRYPRVRDLAQHLGDLESGVGETATRAAPVADERPADEAPLSYAQERLWYVDQVEPGSWLYNDPFTVQISGPLEAATLGRALNEVVARHEILRTTFHKRPQGPAQIAAQELTVQLDVFDATSLPEDERETQVERRTAIAVAQPFVLSQGPLLRALLVRRGDEDSVLLLVFHHTVIDGGSMDALLGELAAAYDAFSRGEPSPLPPVPAQYRDFARKQRRAVEARDLLASLDFWERYLEGAPETLGLHTDGAPTGDRRGGQCERKLGTAPTAALHGLCVAEGVTPFMAILASFAALLQRLTLQDDVVVGAPISERGPLRAESVIGLFLNVISIRADLSGDPTFHELLSRVRGAALQAFEHHAVPFQHVVERVQPQRGLTRPRLFDVMINYDHYEDGAVTAGPTRFRQGAKPAGAARVPLELYVEDHGDHIVLRLLYQRSLFAAGRMERLLEQFVRLLSQVSESPERRTSTYSLVTEPTHALLPDLARRIDAGVFQPVFACIAERARAAPGRAAVSCNGTQLSYGDLVEAATAAARVLVAAGTAKGDVVALCGDRSPALIRAMLGVLEAGGVLLLLDPAIPAARRDVMVGIAGVRFYVDLRSEAGDGDWRDARRVDLGAAEDGSANGTELPEIAADDDAYVMFTSGSTGTPKAIVGRHGGLAHFVRWQRDAFSIGPHDRSGQLTALSFDVVLRDVFTPLVSGATLCVPPPSLTPSARDVVPWIARERITMLHTVPTLATHWVAARPADVTPSSLRMVFFAGEPLQAALVRRWRDAFPDCETVVNLYGPSETTLAKCSYVVPDSPPPGVQPLGNALPGSQVWVAGDEAARFCDIGEPGEIVIRTPHRTRGYLGADADAAARFVPNPVSEDSTDLIYRTGDRGRLLPDGTIEFLGRADDQIKVHGVRVELSEVEAALAQLPGVDQCVVSADGTGAERRLVAHVIAAGAPPAPESLRRELAATLPRAMVPSAFVLVDEFPRTATGKVDRRALPPAGAGRAAAEQRAFVAPHTHVQKRLAAIWADELGLERVGVRDDFFDLGGHSMLAVRLVTRIEEELGRPLPLASLLRAPTIERQASLLDSKSPAPATGDGAASAAVADDEPRSAVFFVPGVDEGAVPLQSDGSRPPLFLVPGRGGHPLTFRHLARLLGPDQPSYGLMLPLERRTKRPTTVQDVARPLVEEIAAIQPQGPVFMAGYSFGAVVAFEIAQQMIARGRPVPLLVLIDPALPRSLRPAFYRVRMHLQQMGELDARERIAYLGKMGVRRLRKLQRKLRLGGTLDPESVTEEEREQARARAQILEMNRLHVQASLPYQPQPYPGLLTLLRRTERSGWYEDALHGWIRLADRGAEVVLVEGEHLKLFREPTVHDVAERLSNCIRKSLVVSPDWRR